MTAYRGNYETKKSLYLDTFQILIKAARKLIFKLRGVFKTHCVKIVRIWSFSGPYFSVFSQMWENVDQKTPNAGTFHAVTHSKINDRALMQK